MRRRCARPRIAVVLPGLTIAILAGRGASAQSMEGYREGQRATVIEVNDLDGMPVDLGQYLGRVPVYLEFWATWCELCEELLPTVREAAAAFGTEVEFIGINIAVNQTPRRVRKYLAQHDPPFMTLYDNLGTSVRAYRVPTTSYVMIIDREGIIQYVGVGGKQEFTQVLRRVTESPHEMGAESP